MTKLTLESNLLEKLKQVDTPTVCNAIEIAQGGRGFNAFTKRTMLASDPTAAAMVGFARTARLAGNAPATAPLEDVKRLRIDYFKYMAAGLSPSLAVIEDIDGDAASGAWWGEVHTTVHKALGLSGAITNGLMRDLGDLAADFPVLAGAIGPSHAFIHVEDFGQPVSIFGMQVKEGDLVHADRHGALVIPPDVIDSLASAIDKLIELEQIILQPARQPDFTIEALVDAWARFEAHRAQ